jgi:pyruvate dehydrogenase E1 component beta subunit
MGGTFGTTRRLHRRFGTDRVRDTPIAEQSFTGMGVGLAMAGYRPLVEIMFVDFIGVALEQVYNAMAKIPYMSGGRVRIPMVLKTAGGCIGSAAQHSQCLWGTFAHLPGMKVVVPATPHDYKGLLLAALESDDPVVYVEHKDLLLWRSDQFRVGGEVPEGRYVVPIGEAAVVRPGSDLTVVTLGRSVLDALDAADELAGQGVEAEVVDLRTVVPLDLETIIGSLARTRRLLVVDEDYLSFGLSGEIVARAVEALGPRGLDGVARVAVPDLPIPAAASLEAVVVPRAEAIVRGAETALGAEG